MHLGIMKPIYQLQLLQINQTIKTLNRIAMLRERETETTYDGEHLPRSLNNTKAVAQKKKDLYLISAPQLTLKEMERI
jgi:hypothetical protein